ncbi:MAG: hypothetical protein LBH72_05190 [Proteiniphilum sp.]|nr:hypothetical protein [Proteiniphilum sp.]
MSLLNSTEGSIRHHLAKLIQEGVIKREGSDRAGKWIIIEE